MSELDRLRASIRVIDRRSADNAPLRSDFHQRLDCSIDRLLETSPAFRAHAERAVAAYGSLDIVMLNSGAGAGGARYNTVFLDERTLATQTYASHGGGFADSTLQQSLFHEVMHTGDPTLIALNRDVLLAGYRRLTERHQELDTARTDNERVAQALRVFNGEAPDSPHNTVLRQGINERSREIIPHRTYPSDAREAYAIGHENALLAQTGRPQRDSTRYGERPEDVGSRFTATPELDHLEGFEGCVRGLRHGGVLPSVEASAPSTPSTTPPQRATTRPVIRP